MIPDRSLPIPAALPTNSQAWTSFKTRLQNWVASATQSFTSQILYQVPVTVVTTTPAAVPPVWTGTVPYSIEFAPPATSTTDPQRQQGTAQAELVIDGFVQWFVPPLDNTGVPVVPMDGEWTVQTLKVMNPVTHVLQDTQVIVAGRTPVAHVWFAFLVAQ